MKNLTFSALICAIPTLNLFAQPVLPDKSFGDNGIVITDIGMHEDEATNILVQPDGKIIVAGRSWDGTYYTFSLVRYMPDGSLDESFDGDGKVLMDLGLTGGGGCKAIALQEDGKILVLSDSWGIMNTDLALVRLNTDGSVDTRFSEDGLVTRDIRGDDDFDNLLIQEDGKIVVVGNTHNGTNIDFAMVRFNSDGTLDSYFGEDGEVFTDFGQDDLATVAVQQEDGQLVVAGITYATYTARVALARYDSNGKLDHSFGLGGMQSEQVSGSGAASAIIQPDGKILVVGTGDPRGMHDAAVFRYNEDGSLDDSFSADGIAMIDFGAEEYGLDIALKPDGKMIVLALSYGTDVDFAVASLNGDGSLNTAFGEEGKITTDLGASKDDFARALALQEDDKIVATGTQTGTSGYYATTRFAINSDETLTSIESGLEVVTETTSGEIAETGIATVETGLMVFPNPASEYVNIVLPERMTNGTIRVTHIDGQVVYSDLRADGASFIIDFSGYADGIYIIEVGEGKKMQQVKVIKN